MTELATKLIKMDGGTQARAGTDRDTIAEYIEALRDSDGAWPFPPVCDCGESISLLVKISMTVEIEYRVQEAPDVL